MAGELAANGHDIAHATFDIFGVVQGLLPRGHVLHGYSSGDNTRVVKILETRAYSDNAPLLGYGEDGRAERALGRALLT